MPRHELTRTLRLLAEPLRLRLLHLLTQEGIGVGELAQALNARQSLVSTQLAKLAEEGLVQTRREGRHSLCRSDPKTLSVVALAALREHAATRQAKSDRESVAQVLRRRTQAAAPDSLGAGYLPGRSWEAFARALLQCLPELHIADIGIGSGEMALLLATHARKVIAVDHDAAALSRLKARAKRAGLSARVECRLRDAAAAPLAAGEVDVVIVSQLLHEVESPRLVVQAAAKGLRPGGQLLILDLLTHEETWVRQRYGHRKLGFSERELLGCMRAAGLTECSVQRVSRDPKPPHFVALLASARKGPRT